MNTHNNLPLYTMEIDGTITGEEGDEGVEFVAFVDRPAIKRGFLAFSDHAQREMAFSVTSEDRRIVSGPLMLADTPIYRKPPQVEAECYVVFPASTIESIVHKFFCQGNQGNVNLMHDSARQVDGIVMFESFISDSARGISPMKGYEDAPEGSWFGSFMVDNEDVWASIKDGTFTGFSVEGMFAQVIPIDAPEFQEEGWWNDPDLQFTDEERAKMAAVWDILNKVEV